MALLLPHIGAGVGVPLQQSTQQSFNNATTLLHQLGRFVTLKQSADMVRHGMAVGAVTERSITLRMSDRVATDHFLDRLDAHRLDELDFKTPGRDPVQAFVDASRVDERRGPLGLSRWVGTRRPF